MAAINATRYAEVAQKKGVPHQMCFHINDDFAKECGLPYSAGSTVNVLLGHVPEDSFFTRSLQVTRTVMSGAGFNKLSFGTTEGGNDLKTVNLTIKRTEQNTMQLDTGVGLPIYAKFELVDDITTYGDHYFSFEYVEFTKTTGEYTKFS